MGGGICFSLPFGWRLLRLFLHTGFRNTIWKMENLNPVCISTGSSDARPAISSWFPNTNPRVLGKLWGKSITPGGLTKQLDLGHIFWLGNNCLNSRDSPSHHFVPTEAPHPAFAFSHVLQCLRPKERTFPEFLKPKQPAHAQPSWVLLRVCFPCAADPSGFQPRFNCKTPIRVLKEERFSAWVHYINKWNPTF